MSTNKSFITNIGKIVTKTIFRHDLIQNGDSILVALSGGKDSLVLLETLAQRKRHMPLDYSLYAVHIQAENITYNVDLTFLQNFCDRLEVPLYIKNISIDLSGNKKSPCFICSWYRRRELFGMTNRLNCNKLAMGHHVDDTIETLLMNMIHHGSISSLPAKLSMFQGKFEIIRPLIQLHEEDIQKYNDIRHFPKSEKTCPYDMATSRYEIKQLLEQLEAQNENAKKNIFLSMTKIYESYLPQIPHRRPDNTKK